MRWLGLALVLPLVACGSSSDSGPSPAPASLREQVDALIQPGVASGRWASVVVGVYDRGTTSSFAYGRVRADGPAPDARTVYEIGSVTKTFTAALVDQQSRVAEGHDERGRVTPGWDMNAHAPAGGLRSTQQDMLQYVAALLGHGPLAADLAACRQARFVPADQPFQLGLAWHVVPLGRTGRTYVFHNGGTGGYTSFVGYLPDRDAGVAILTSSANLADAQGEALLEWLAAR